MDDDRLKINPPLYLIGKIIYCWHCRHKMSAVAFLAPHVDGTENQVCLLSNIEELPEDILTYIQKRVPTFKKEFSKTVKQAYYVNTCPRCGMLSGDFFLHSEPGAPFFPINNEEAKSLYITEIPLLSSIIVMASFSIGVGDLILDNAKRT